MKNTLVEKYKTSILAAVSLLLIILLIVTNTGRKKAKKQEVSEARFSELQVRLDSLQEILDADERLFAGAYERALDRYAGMAREGGRDTAPSITLRMEHARMLLQEEDSLQEQVRSYRYELHRRQQETDSLRRQFARLEKICAAKQDTMREKLASLQQTLEAKQKELSQRTKKDVLTFQSHKGSHKVIYLGEVQNGKAQGGGVGIWSATGSMYRGAWRDNKRHGEGTFEWADGEKYVGEYVDDRREGEGTYYWPSGERYEGEWKGDRRNGHGVLYDRNGNITYEGKWVNDKPAE